MNFLLGFLHVDQVSQAYNKSGDEEANYNSNHQLGLVTVIWLIWNKIKTQTSDTVQGETPAWMYMNTKRKLLCAISA